MITKENIKRFKRGFWGANPIIQVEREGKLHKLKSLKNKTADFLTNSKVTYGRFLIKFREVESIERLSQKSTSYEIQGLSPRILYNTAPSEAPALETIYDALEHIHQRCGTDDLYGLVTSAIWRPENPRKFL
ncbi:MAG: hypothetical protein AABX88_03045 [Nanoarchaeota archaeon]